ncbi:MAG: hypothetical protein PVJ67_05915 [Candidatus Pacearchaeota archaeon]|jgi:hypothetical protein
MIEKIMFYPNRHEDFKIENEIVHSIKKDFKKGNLDSVFFETNYPGANLTGGDKKYVIRFLPEDIPLFGAEFKPYHKRHIKIIQKVVLFCKAMESKSEINREELTKVFNKHKEASKKRMEALAQNVLLKCSDLHYKRPGIVCGGKHKTELENLFEKRGYDFKVCKDYLDILDKERKRSDYAIRNFSVPLIEYSKI